MSSAERAIFASADRLMTSRPAASSVRTMRPVTVDRILAAVLLVIAEAEVWATHDAGGHRISAALVAPVLQACLALRRRYPLAAGLVAATTESIQFGIASNTQVIATSIAWFCALYGLSP